MVSLVAASSSIQAGASSTDDSPWDVLSGDHIAAIFSHLPLGDLRRCREVSGQWRRVVSDDLLLHYDQNKAAAKAAFKDQERQASSDWMRDEVMHFVTVPDAGRGGLFHTLASIHLGKTLGVIQKVPDLSEGQRNLIIVSLTVPYDLAAAKNRALAQSGELKDFALREVAAVEAQSDVEEAKTTAGLIQNPQIRVDAFLDIAKFEKNPSFEEAIQAADEIQGPSLRDSYLLNIIGEVARYDLTKAEQIVDSMQSSSWKDTAYNQIMNELAMRYREPEAASVMDEINRVASRIQDRDDLEYAWLSVENTLIAKPQDDSTEIDPFYALPEQMQKLFKLWV